MPARCNMLCRFVELPFWVAWMSQIFVCGLDIGFRRSQQSTLITSILPVFPFFSNWCCGPISTTRVFQCAKSPGNLSATVPINLNILHHRSCLHQQASAASSISAALRDSTAFWGYVEGDTSVENCAIVTDTVIVQATCFEGPPGRTDKEACCYSIN